jgi:serine/threonine protein kinase
LTPCGTVGYTAPEIVRDQQYSKSVDMWAIGCVLYTILCGFPPFYDESIRALTHKVARGEYTFLSPWWDPISPAAKDLIQHLLCVDPEKRYTIEQFFQHPWVTKSKFPPPASKNIIDNSLPLKPLTEKKKMPVDARTQAIQNAAARAAARAAAAQEELDRNAQLNESVPITTTSQPSTPTKAKRTDVFSPGINSIKEILDITYAVQRMGEEKKKSRFGLSEPSRGLGGDQDTGSEEDDDDDTSSDSSGSYDKLSPHYGIQKEVYAMAEQLVQDGKGIAPGAYSVSSQQQQMTGEPVGEMTTPISRKKRNVFELDMKNATLLKNRRVAT